MKRKEVENLNLKVCRKFLTIEVVTEAEQEKFLKFALRLSARSNWLMFLTFHLDLAKFFFSCSETVAWMFRSDWAPVIQQCSRAASQVSRWSTLTHIRDLMKSLASSLMSSQQGESNSNSPAKQSLSGLLKERGQCCHPVPPRECGYKTFKTKFLPSDPG